MAGRAIQATAALERFFSRRLGVSVSLRIERCGESDADPRALRRRLSDRSRAVLGGMMRRAGRGGVYRARRMRFPQCRCSISHSAGTVVCATVTGARVGGLGVDLEFQRPVPPAAARLYLTDRERRSLDLGSADAEGDRLRLWTVKEALYKADMGNRTRGWLASYECLDPRRRSGAARLRPGPVGKRFRFATIRYRSGFLTLAVSDGRSTP